MTTLKKLQKVKSDVETPKSYYQNKKDLILEKRRKYYKDKYYQTNKELMLQKRRKYHKNKYDQTNKELILEKRRKNKDLILEKKRENKELILQKRKENKELILERRRKNKELILEKKRKYYKHDYDEFFQIKDAFNKTYKRYRINGKNAMDVNIFWDKLKSKLIKLVNEQLEHLNSLKIQTTMWIKFTKEIAESNEKIDVDKAFNSRMTQVFQGNNLDEILEDMFSHMKTQIEHPALPRSGFTIDKILHLDVDFHKLNLTRGSSYLPLPNEILIKKAIINPINKKDEQCFKWAVIAALNNFQIKYNPERINNLKKFENLYNWNGLEFPMAMNKIDKFKRNNPEISVNVLSHNERSDIYICRKSKYCDRKHNVNLFFLCAENKNHYAAIKSLSRLLGGSNSKHGHQEHFCINCLQGFNSIKTRDNHFEYCKNNDAVNSVLMEK